MAAPLVSRKKAAAQDLLEEVEAEKITRKMQVNNSFV